MTLDIGRATAGASRATPMKMQHGAQADELRSLASVSPTANASTPTEGEEAPRLKRRRNEMSVSVCCSDTAATGAIRTARRAGLMAETTVTPTPTTRQTITVRASNTSGPDGSVTPNPLSSASSPSAASTPRPSPISEDESPTIAASPAPSGTPAGGWPRRSATARAHAFAARR